MAETIEVANAYVALTTKMPGVQKDIERELGAVDADRAGAGLGTKLSTGLKRTALVGAAAVGGAIVATLGVALTKGFQRLQGIDNATAKMKGLGFTAEETQGLMDNALESVRGTAFGLEDAATVAAQLAATGIGPGEEMADILSTIANTSAAAGAGMEEMGSIFAKVASSGKAQNDSLQQLSDRGIPIYQALAEQLGVTTDEVFKLASAGEIGFEEFAEAAQAAGGDVAAAMGDTFSGSWANMMASLGRIGAGLLSGVFDKLAPAIQGVTGALGPLEDVAKAVGENIGSFLAPFFEGLAALGDGGLDFGMFGELLSYMSPLGLVFKTIQPVLPLIVDAFAQIGQVLGSTLQSVLEAVLPILSELVLLFAEGIALVIPMILPILTSVAELFGQIVAAVLPLLPPLFELVEAIMPLLILAFEQVANVVQLAVDVLTSFLGPAIEGISDLLSGIITFLTGVFTGDWEKAWEGVLGIFSGIWNALVGIVEGTINGMIDLINGFLSGLNDTGDWLSDITGGVIGFELGTIPHVSFDAVKLAEGGVVQATAGGTLSLIGEAGRDEAVIPLPNDWKTNGLSGLGKNIQIDVHPSPGMDEEIIGRAAAREVGYMLRGA